MRVSIYGIKNCNTMKAAMQWLTDHGVAFVFHDYKKEGVDPALLSAWCDEAGWEKVMNRAGITFRKLPPESTAGLDKVRAMALMQDKPSMIKRPVLIKDGKILIGFKPDLYERFFVS